MFEIHMLCRFPWIRELFNNTQIDINNPPVAPSISQLVSEAAGGSDKNAMSVIRQLNIVQDQLMMITAPHQ
eukprot:gene6651-2598_t